MFKRKKIPFFHSHFGVNDYDFWFHLRPLKETKLIFDYGSKLISDAGIHWDRVHLPGVFSWNVVEYVKGKYDWTIPDTLVREAQSYNINLLPNLWPFAAWDQKAWEGTGRRKIDTALAMGIEYAIDDSCPIPPRYDGPHDLDAYSRWVTAMVERYDGDGVDDMPGLKYPIKYWEPGNEVFSILNWPTGDPKTFAKFTKISYLAVKKANPECKVVLANANEVFNLPSTSEFYRAIMELGNKDGKQYFDIVNLHGGYGSSFFLRLIKDFERLMDTFGVKAGIWVTEFSSGQAEPRPYPTPEVPEEFKCPYAKPRKKDEFGIPIEDHLTKATPPPTRKIPTGKVKHPTASKRTQAVNLFKALTTAFYNGVKRVFFTGFGPIRPIGLKLTKPIPATYDDYSSSCMLDCEGKSRLVYYTTQLFMAKLDMFQKIEKLKLEKDVEAYRYIMNTKLYPKSECLYVLWSDTGASATLTGLKSSFITLTETVPKSDEKENVILDPASDPQFNVRRVKVVEGKVYLKLSETPVLLEP